MKLETTAINEKISEIEKMFNHEFPGNLFNWYFLDEKVAAQYVDQKKGRGKI